MKSQRGTHQVSAQTDAQLIEKLLQLDLSEDEANGYLVLLSAGRMGATSLSNRTGLPRTNTYRLIDRLESMGLIEFRDGKRGTEVVARPPTALEQLVVHKQQAVTAQKELLPSLLGELTNLSGRGALGSRIVYYEGIEGLQQVTLNSLDATSGISIYEISNLTGFMSQDFAESFRRELVRREISIRQLTNINEYDEFTEVTEVLDQWDLRYVDPKQLAIEFEIVIYNDVCAFYNYRDDDVFCVEIRSSALANMQRSIFNIIWSLARPMKPVETGSSARKVARSTKPTRRL